jgi:hypothetical protein
LFVNVAERSPLRRVIGMREPADVVAMPRTVSLPPTVEALVGQFFAKKRSIYGICESDPDYWKEMSWLLAVEQLSISMKAPREPKPRKWDEALDKKLIADIEAKTATGSTVMEAAKWLCKIGRYPDQPKSLASRYPAAKKREKGRRRDRMAEIILRHRPAGGMSKLTDPTPVGKKAPTKRPRRAKKSSVQSTKY